jgi:hypothetical protein
VTLPDSTLELLSCIDRDRARAIVKATNAVQTTLAGKRHSQVELVEVEPGLGIILVGPTRMLEKIAGLRLAEVAPLRFLITLSRGTSIDSIELSISDLLEEFPGKHALERATLVQLRDLFRELRRRGKLSTAEMLFVDTHDHVDRRSGASDRSGSALHARQQG